MICFLHEVLLTAETGNANNLSCTGEAALGILVLGQFLGKTLSSWHLIPFAATFEERFKVRVIFQPDCLHVFGCWFSLLN